MKTLLAFGCSNTLGNEAIIDNDVGVSDEDNINYAYPKYVAELLRYEYRNFAESGASNQQIASKVHEVISKTSNVKDIFILIGWTDDQRITVIKDPAVNFKKSEKTVTLSRSHVLSCLKMHLGEPLSRKEMDCINGIRTISAEFVINLSDRIFNSKNYDDVNFYIKYAMTCFLKERGIPHLTLPTLHIRRNSLYNAFFGANKNNILQYDNNGERVFDFLEHYKKYGIAKSGAHLKAEAHRQIGNYLYEYIIDNKLIQ